MDGLDGNMHWYIVLTIYYNLASTLQLSVYTYNKIYFNIS